MELSHQEAYFLRELEGSDHTLKWYQDHDLNGKTIHVGLSTLHIRHSREWSWATLGLQKYIDLNFPLLHCLYSFLTVGEMVAHVIVMGNFKGMKNLFSAAFAIFEGKLLSLNEETLHAVQSFIDHVTTYTDDSLTKTQKREIVFGLLNQLARALMDLHDRRIVHRDIKCGNVLVHQGKVFVSKNQEIVDYKDDLWL